jgi:hypothetical protein
VRRAQRAPPWSPSWKTGCAPSAPNSRPNRLPAHALGGLPPDSSMTAASVSRRMVLTRGNRQPGVAVMAGAVGGFSFHAATIRS